MESHTDNPGSPWTIVPPVGPTSRTQEILSWLDELADLRRDRAHDSSALELIAAEERWAISWLERRGVRPTRVAFVGGPQATRGVWRDPNTLTPTLRSEPAESGNAGQDSYVLRMDAQGRWEYTWTVVDTTRR
jgi:hypothetical protein